MTQRVLDILLHFTSFVATSPSSSRVKQALVDHAVDAIGATSSAAVFVGHDAGTPVIAATRSFDARPALPHDDQSIAATLLKASTSVRAVNIVRVPLVAEGRARGTLYALLDATVPVDSDAVRACTALADVAAVSIVRSDEQDVDDAADDSKRALAQSEKLRALGGMAAGISHDLKNVFGPLLMQLDVLARKPDVDVAFLKDRLEKMRRPLENGLAIVERLRSFSRRSASDEREVIDIGTVVDDAVGVCRPRVAGSEVEVVVAQGEAPKVRIEVAEAVAAVTNLVMNALDAVGAKGSVHVSYGARDGGAFVDVVDTGPGVPLDVGERVFEPFFTTKGALGTGLGLPMVREFARRHAGTVSLGRGERGGARFTLWLPSANSKR